MIDSEIVRIYKAEGSINGTARVVKMSHNKVRKVLITAGILSYPQTKEAQARMANGESVEQIAESWGCKVNAVNNYLPYTRQPYGFNQTQKAIQLQQWRKKKKEECNNG